MTSRPDEHSIPVTVKSLLPQLRRELGQLVRIPSVSAPGYPEPRRPLLEAYETILGLMRDAGVERLGSLELPDTAPVVTGEIPGPDGSPTVLLYGHYDVVPAGDEAKWDFAAVRGDASAAGRSTVAAPPTPSRTSSCTSERCARGRVGRRSGIKILIEGQEEVGSPLEEVPAELGRFRSRRDADRRRGLHPAGRAVAHGRPPRRRRRHRRGTDAREREALGAVRWCGSRRSDRICCTGSRHCATRTVTSPWRACAASRGRAGRGRDDEFRQLAEIASGLPFMGSGPVATGCGRERRDDHRARDRRAVGRGRGQRRRRLRTRAAQRPRAPAADGRRGAGGGHPAPRGRCGRSASR